MLFSPPNLWFAAQASQEKIKLTSEAKRAREYALRILDEMKDILKHNYYDSKMRGIDLENRIETAKARVKTMQYNWQMYRVLVQVLMDFNDSHTTYDFAAENRSFSIWFRDADDW